jgi:4-coumarate--CoA ligase
MQVATAAAANAGIPREHVFLLEGKAEGFATIQELMDIGKSYGRHCQSLPYSIPRNRNNGDVCGFLCVSSGTTGLPKAASSQSECVCEYGLTVEQVMPSHQNIIAQAFQHKMINPPGPSQKNCRPTNVS